MLLRIDNTDINEYTCRLFSLFMQKSKEFKLQFINVNGYSVVTDIFKSKETVPKSLIRTLMDASTNAFDNPNVFYPSTSSIVHQLMNDTKIAS